MRRRISLSQEDRIWALRCQGLRYEAISILTGIPSTSLPRVVRRVRRRPPLTQDPIRMGRRHSHLNDAQVAVIRRRYAAGERATAIANDFDISWQAVVAIARGRSYRNTPVKAPTPAPQVQPVSTATNPFANRLLHA